MTLAPLVIPEIRGVEGKPVELAQWCVAPGCISRAQQRHHLWPRSFLRGQPFEWVEVDGKVIPNSVGLCVKHHSMVTGEKGHPAKIVYEPDVSLFYWYENADYDEEWLLVGPLKNQGLIAPEPEARAVRRREGLCPECGRPHPKPKGMTLPPRHTKSWSLLVPDDAENGAEVLDTAVEELAALMGLDPESPRLLRYHVLVPVLSWVLQEKVRFVGDWDEAGVA